MSATELSDFEDNVILNDRNDGDEANADGYASDEAIEDENFREDGESNDSKKRRIDPTAGPKRTIKKQPRLDPERLKGPKGIHVIEKHFENFKFRGKGNEISDLNRVMKELEYWSHRLFPKLEFDDCLVRLEALGAKKPVQTHLTKIRLGLLTDNDVSENKAIEEDEDVVQDEAPIDEFDALIAEQLEKQRHSMTPQTQNSSILSADSNATPAAFPGALPKKDIAITPDMKERIERNRQMAIQKRLARIEAEKARKEASQDQDDNETLVDKENSSQATPEGSIIRDSIREQQSLD